MSASRLQSSPSVSAKSLHNPQRSFTGNQASLFATILDPVPGSLNDEGVVRAIVTESIRDSEKSRDQIADEMTRLTGDRITVRMLNSYTSEAAEQHRWPAQYTRAFCHVIHDWRLLRCIAERSGFHLINDDEAELLELGRQFLIQKRASEQVALLEARLSGVEL